MTVDEIANILVQAISQDSPLREGEHRREAIRSHLATGASVKDSPYQYRVKFLHDTAMACIDVMIEKSDDFNQKYPGDQVGTADLIDVVLTTLNMIVKQVGFAGLDVRGPVITIVKK